MLATTQGSEDLCAVAETSDGSARMDQETGLSNADAAIESEKPTKVTAASTRQMTDNQLLNLSIVIREMSHQTALLTLSYLRHSLTMNLTSSQTYQPSLQVRIKLHLHKIEMSRVTNLKPTKGNLRRQYRSKQR